MKSKVVKSWTRWINVDPYTLIHLTGDERHAKLLRGDCDEHEFVSRFASMSACPIVPRRDVEWRVNVAEHVRAAIESLVSTQKTLEDVVRWGLGQKPVQMVKDIVIQDEYTHDVVIYHPSGVWLVYDST